MDRVVEIGMEIEGKKLEEILYKSAKKVGLLATSVDRQYKQYRLGSVHEEKVYDCTIIRLRKGIFPFAEIAGIDRNIKRSWFVIRTRMDSVPPFFGFASKKQVERYLGAVSECFQAS